jgi:hypothetical protein
VWARAFAVALLLWLPAMAGGQTGVARVLPPVDEAPRDASLTAFRGRLVQAVRERDGASLSAMIDAPAAEDFERTWGIRSHPDTSRVWDVLGGLLPLGGSFLRADMFCAPYVYTRFPDAVRGAYYWGLFVPGAPLFAAASSFAPLVGGLGYVIFRSALLPAPDRYDHPAWLSVQRADGSKGYMRGRDVRSPLDYRACFVKRADGWKLSALAAGD